MQDVAFSMTALHPLERHSMPSGAVYLHLGGIRVGYTFVSTAPLLILLIGYKLTSRRYPNRVLPQIHNPKRYYAEYAESRQLGRTDGAVVEYFMPTSSTLLGPSSQYMLCAVY